MGSGAGITTGSGAGITTGSGTGAEITGSGDGGSF